MKGDLNELVALFDLNLEFSNTHVDYVFLLS